MFSFFKKFFQQRENADVGFYPIIHSFPNVGTDGEVTIDCVIRPTTGGTERMPCLMSKRTAGSPGFPRSVWAPWKLRSMSTAFAFGGSPERWATIAFVFRR